MKLPFEQGIKYLIYAAIFLAFALLFKFGPSSFWADAAATHESRPPMDLVFALAALGYGLTGVSKLLNNTQPESPEPVEHDELAAHSKANP